jgi:hypothetical protein
MAHLQVALLFGTRVAETILASVHVRAHQQAGHMDASDLIKTLQNTLRGGGRPHMGLGLFRHLETPQTVSDRRPAAKFNCPFMIRAFAIRSDTRLAKPNLKQAPQLEVPKL